MNQFFDKNNYINDERIVKAKRLITETVQEYQARYIHILQGEKKSEALSYKMAEKLRGGALFYPYIGTGLGHGSKVLLTDGSIKLDFINGIGAHFGHGLEFLRNASIDAALEDTIMQGNLQQNERSFELMKLLIHSSKMDHCILTSSGAMANENALKLLFHSQPGKNRIIAFEQCFMGRTLALAQITDKAMYRTGLPNTINVDYIPFFDPKNPKKSIQSCVSEIYKLLKRYPNQHAGLCMELIQGEGGYNIGDSLFFKKIIEVMKNESIPVMVDEVQTFGRTSELFASKHFEIIDNVDIISIGKLSQTCATLYKKKLAPKPGIISQTYTSSTTAIECGYQIIHYLLDNQHFGADGKNMVYGNFFNRSLKHLGKKHSICGPFGLGGLIAFTPYDGDANKVKSLLYQLYNNGLMGFTTGSYPMRIRFLLPLGSVNKKEIEEAIQIIDKTFSENE